MGWINLVLTTDGDIRAVERKMPELAMRFKGESGASAYDGKRDLCKTDFFYRLKRMGIDFSTIPVPDRDKYPSWNEASWTAAETEAGKQPGYFSPYTVLNNAAVFHELELIYRDLSDRNDTVSTDKANLYADRYEKAWQDVVMELSADVVTSGMTTIPLHRA